jgi:hypothetical protein
LFAVTCVSAGKVIAARLTVALSFHIGADLIRDLWRYLIYEAGACFDGLYCFVWVGDVY